VRFLPLIIANLLRKKLRSTLTLLSIVVAFVLFGYLSAIKQALVGGVSLAGANRLFVRHKTSIIQLLPETYNRRIEGIQGVAKATHFTWFGGHFGDSKHFFPQMPCVPDELFDMYPEFLLPAEQKHTFLHTRASAIVGRKTADFFHWKVGDRIPILSSIWIKKDGSQTWEFEIVGIFDGKEKTTDTTQLFFHYDYFEEARRWSKGTVGWYIVRVSDPDQAPRVAQRIDTEFENSTAETKTETEAAFTQGFAKQIGDIALITAVILGAVFFTILLVTGNTMAQSIRERIGELGALKALGFRDRQVLMLVMAESCMLSCLGGVLGLGLALLLTSGGDPTGGRLPLFYFRPRDVFVGFCISIGLGILTGIFPALQAMRLRVAESLRRM
jgi:putative ABC transport system permease protein